MFLSPCRFPAELLNYQPLLFPGVCARGYTGIDMYIFVDVIMFLCMHVSLFLSLQPSSKQMSERAIKSAPTNVVCVHMRLYSRYSRALGWLDLAAFTVTVLPGGWGLVEVTRAGSMGGQFHWQVAAEWINYHRSSARPFQPACSRSREGESTRMLKATSTASFCGRKCQWCCLMAPLGSDKCKR